MSKIFTLLLFRLWGHPVLDGCVAHGPLLPVYNSVVEVYRLAIDCYFGDIPAIRVEVVYHHAQGPSWVGNAYFFKRRSQQNKVRASAHRVKSDGGPQIPLPRLRRVTSISYRSGGSVVVVTR